MIKLYTQQVIDIYRCVLHFGDKVSIRNDEIIISVDNDMWKAVPDNAMWWRTL